METSLDIRSVNRILISRMKFIGDVILTTPVIRALRDNFPHAFIAYLGDSRAVSLLRHNPCLDELIGFDFMRPAILEQPRVMYLLRRRKFDVFIDLFCNPRTALLARVSGAPVRIGKEVKGRGALYTHRIRDDGKPKSAIAFHYQYLRLLGVEPTRWRTEIDLTADERREASIYLKWQGLEPDRPVVGLHPGATWPAKRWQVERFAELVDLLAAKLHVQTVITQGPGDAGVVAEVSRLATANLAVLPVLPLRQLAAVIASCAVYVSNDCGPMHIAPAVGTPTIGIFGPGEDDIWFPYVPPYYDASAGHVALRRDVPCHPCHLDFCDRSGDGYMECMKLLTAEEVLEEVRKRLGRTDRNGA